ncbi:MAG: hypothetical protein D6775_14740 [Caldilineae bacterium]|nr:MAG: hypothetical protein D6775_14740 [Caldilineae bacterium]
MTIRSWIAIVLLLAVALEASGRQLVEAADGDTVTVRVSLRDLTRIRVDGGRIKRLMGVQNVFDVQREDDRGEVLIRPRVATPFSFFLTTATGETFTVLATPIDIPSETVVIRPKVRDLDRRSPAGPATLPRVARIKRLVRAMALRDKHFYRVSIHEAVPLWKELEITRTARWPGSLIGEEYEVRNTTDHTLRLDEREFTAFGDDVVAVSITRRVLPAKSITQVYVVRQRQRTE